MLQPGRDQVFDVAVWAPAGGYVAAIRATGSD